MTEPDPEDDALDRRIRAAADLPFDDIAATEAVLARVRAQSEAGRPRPAAPSRSPWAAWAGPVAFASVLLATPFVVAWYPGSDEALLIGLATGDPRALFGDGSLGGSLGIDGGIDGGIGGLIE